MLAADAQTQVRGWSRGRSWAAILISLANANLVQMLERIALVDLGVVVGSQELGSVVTAEAEGHLGQVVGAEAEEVSFLGDLAGGQGSTRDLDHGNRSGTSCQRQPQR